MSNRITLQSDANTIWNRYLIEENFRIIKTYFEGRPVYSYTKEHITSHFYICFTALLIYRIIECLLKDQGTPVTTAELIDTLKNMNALKVADIYYTAAYSDSKALKVLEKLTDLKLDYQNYQLNELSKKLKKLQK